MKALYVTACLERGDAERQLSLLARGLKTRGHEVRVCSLTGDGPLARELAAAQVPVDVLGNGRSLDPRPLFRLRDRLRRFDPDIVHTWQPLGNTLGRLASIRQRVPLVATAHLDDDPAQVWGRWLMRDMHRRTRRWIVPCDALVSYWLQRGVHPEAAAVIGPAVEAAPAPAESPAEVRKSLQLPPRARLIACEGRLVPRAGVKDALWAIDILKYLYDDLYLLVVGDGPQRYALEQFARDVQAIERVRFIREHDDLPSLLGACELVWAPAHVDDVPRAVLEAMASGKPVVGSRLPGIAAVVSDGITGCLTPPGDKAALARATRTLLDDAVLRDTMGRAARAYALSTLAPERLIDDHLRLYEQVLAER